MAGGVALHEGGPRELVEAADGARRQRTGRHLLGLQLACFDEVVSQGARGDVLCPDHHGHPGLLARAAAIVLIAGEEVDDHPAHHEEGDPEHHQQI